MSNHYVVTCPACGQTTAVGSGDCSWCDEPLRATTPKVKGERSKSGCLIAGLIGVAVVLVGAGICISTIDIDLSFAPDDLSFAPSGSIVDHLDPGDWPEGLFRSEERVRQLALEAARIIDPDYPRSGIVWGRPDIKESARCYEPDLSNAFRSVKQFAVALLPLPESEDAPLLPNLQALWDHWSDLGLNPSDPAWPFAFQQPRSHKLFQVYLDDGTLLSISLSPRDQDRRGDWVADSVGVILEWETSCFST